MSKYLQTSRQLLGNENRLFNFFISYWLCMYI